MARPRLAAVALAGGAMFCAAMWLLLAQPSRGEEAKPSEPVAVERRENIRVVYQIKDDDWLEGVGKGLAYLKKLVTAYRTMGVPAKEVHVSAVFHGNAGYWMLRDGLYEAHARKPGGNPNQALIRELLDAGVSIELCAQTMREHSWKPEDVLPGVRIVVGAYPRVIDLELRGYAYIRF